MNISSVVVSFLLGLGVVFGGASQAATSGALYDMSRLLNQPHPFAKNQSAGRLPAEPPAVMMPAEPAPARTQQQAPAPRPAAGRKTLSRKSEPVPYSKPGGAISEIRLGAFIHDEGPFSHKKESGYDGNIEVLFSSPDIFKAVWSPRPHIGTTINSDNLTHQAYAGLTWEWEFLTSFYFDFSLGGAYHTGKTETDDPKRKSLGCSVLFRESLDLGYRINDTHSVTAHLSHISNAKLCSTNEGLETFGIRYGYRF